MFCRFKQVCYPFKTQTTSSVLLGLRSALKYDLISFHFIHSFIYSFIHSYKFINELLTNFTYESIEFNLKKFCCF